VSLHRVPKKSVPETRNAAWIGDAVLSLYVREWILREHGAMDGVRLTAFTSNRFLSAFGNPTEVEAEIGAVYEKAGLSAAFAAIEERLLPVFLAQERRRLRERRA
jgi:dsRNA-specific ribonuclease